MRFAGVVAVGLLVAGCGSVTEPRVGTNGPVPLPSAASPSSATAASAFAATERENAKLLALVRVPAGSSKVDGPPVAALDQPAQHPATPDLLDDPTFYTLPLTVNQSKAWFAAHAPTGLSHDGYGSAGTDAHPVTDDVYSSHDASPSFSEPGLLYSYTPLGDGTALRVDAQTIVVHPHSAAEVVPPTDTTATLSAYRGSESSVVASRTLDPAQTHALALLLNGAATTSGVRGCTLDQGFRIKAAFPQSGQAFVLDPSCGSLAVTTGGQPQPGLDTDGAVSSSLYGDLGVSPAR